MLGLLSMPITGLQPVEVHLGPQVAMTGLRLTAKLISCEWQRKVLSRCLLGLRLEAMREMRRWPSQNQQQLPLGQRFAATIRGRPHVQMLTRLALGPLWVVWQEMPPKTPSRHRQTLPSKLPAKPQRTQCATRVRLRLTNSLLGQQTRLAPTATRSPRLWTIPGEVLLASFLHKLIPHKNSSRCRRLREAGATPSASCLLAPLTAALRT
mmetsp:Transcript_4874/g.13532  ORF Transcript_4874/g.13532 Transcript_4874/m.13532 type:complete len:209 (-) Transcript_4874:1288-1914(-)